MTRDRRGGLRVRAAFALALVVIVSACSSTKSHPTVSSSTTGVASAKTSADWPLPGQNYDNARAAIGGRITRATVSDLKVAFKAKVPALGALSTAPLVVGDTVFVQGSTGSVIALDRVSGNVKWTSTATGFNIGPFGVAVASGRVFADDGSTGVLALDEQTGKPLWHRHLSATKTLGVDIQPTVFDGIVLASTVPVSISGIYAPGDRGTIYALDATTGTVRWSFDTVQGDLWGHPDVNSGGGSWYPPAIDVKRHTVYFGTANPAPFPGTAQYPNGASRPGANLYTDSLVALDLATGKLRWYHQVTAHDLYDRDQVHAMLAQIAGGREVVVSAGKSGEVVGLDPDTGRVLWQRPVGKHQHDTDPTLKGPTTVYPGTYGGVETPPATADGVAYIATLNSPTKLEPNKTSYFGSQLGTGDGEVVAVNAANGHVVWDTVVPGDPLGGATVVNDLVFTALLDGTIVALRRDTGGIVWKYKADGGINGWLSATADTLYVPVGQSSPPQILALRLPAP